MTEDTTRDATDSDDTPELDHDARTGGGINAPGDEPDAGRLDADDL